MSEFWLIHRFIVKGFVTSWIGILGDPCKLFSDSGSEFIGQNFAELCETYNIKVTTTALYRRRINGTCEHHNQFTITICYIKSMMRLNEIM